MRFHRPHVFVPLTKISVRISFVIQAVTVSFLLGLFHQAAKIFCVEFRVFPVFKNRPLKIKAAQNINQNLACVLQIQIDNLDFIKTIALPDHVLLDNCFCKCACCFCQRHRIIKKCRGLTFHAIKMVCVSKLVRKGDYVTERSRKI